jgi:hypothetical protein
LGGALEELEFSKCENDWGIYAMRNKDGTPTMLLLAYMDDLVIAAKSTKVIKHFFDSLSTKCRMTSLGESKHILGLKIQRDRSNKSIHLSQPAYIDKLAERFIRYLNSGPQNGFSGTLSAGSS